MNRINSLIDQFVKANNIRNIDLNSKEFLKDFQKYLENMKNHGRDYTHFLYTLGLEFMDQSCAEFGKGKDDTVVDQFNTTIITTDPAYNFKYINPNRIMRGNMIVCNNEPYLQDRENFHRLPFYIKTYMTQNPYNENTLKDIADLHNSDNASIIFGIYGSIYDKDMTNKVKQIKRLKHMLYQPYIEECGNENETYFYAVGSSDKKVKVRTRARLSEYVKSTSNAVGYVVKKR